jgi:hypothetical protein
MEDDDERIVEASFTALPVAAPSLGSRPSAHAAVGRGAVTSVIDGCEPPVGQLSTKIRKVDLTAAAPPPAKSRIPAG